MLSPIIIIGFIVIASSSSMFTALHLWQLKEWRYDRMMEHIRRVGVIPLVGTMRPALIGGAILLWLTCITFDISLTIDTWFIGTMSVLAILNICQSIARKQPHPVWTAKAILISMLVLAIEIIVTTLIMKEMTTGKKQMNMWWTLLLSLIPLRIPVLTYLAVMIVMPIDMWIRRRIFAHAKKLRDMHPHMIVIGITGSVGKTTAKELIYHILAGNSVYCTPEHVNTELGVAKWLIHILKNEPLHSRGILIVEMGAYKRGEIALMCDYIKPTIGVLTYIGTQHMALFGSQENIICGKSELLEAVQKNNGISFVNNDSEHCKTAIQKTGGRVVTVGTDHHAEKHATDIMERPEGITFTVDSTTFTLPLAGLHMVTSALLGIAVANYLGKNRVEIAHALRTFTGFAHTFEKKMERGVTILDNTFSSSREAMEAALVWAKEQHARKKILLCTGIIELGDEEEIVHKNLAQMAEGIVNRVILTSEEFLPYFAPILKDRVEVLSPLTVRSTPGDLLLCIGRMSQKTIEQLLPIQESQ